MGRWGTRPMDSDGAMDYVFYIDNAINKELSRILNQKSHNTDEKLDKVGIVEYMLMEGHHIHKSLIVKSIKNLKGVLEDAEFMSSWRYPEQARNTLVKTIGFFIALLDIYRKREEVWYVKGMVLTGKHKGRISRHFKNRYGR